MKQLRWISKSTGSAELHLETAARRIIVARTAPTRMADFRAQYEVWLPDDMSRAVAPKLSEVVDGALQFPEEVVHSHQIYGLTRGMAAARTIAYEIAKDAWLDTEFTPQMIRTVEDGDTTEWWRGFGPELRKIGMMQQLHLGLEADWRWWFVEPRTLRELAGTVSTKTQALAAIEGLIQAYFPEG